MEQASAELVEGEMGDADLERTTPESVIDEAIAARRVRPERRDRLLESVRQDRAYFERLLEQFGDSLPT